MKKLFTTAILVLFILVVKGQILNPVRWSYAAKRLNKNEAVIFLKANIDDGWHIYSQFIKDNGPTRTEFNFYPSKNYKLIGSVSEPKGITKYDKNFKMNFTYFEKDVIFKQKVRLITQNQTVINGKLNFGTCNDHQCLPPEDVGFKVVIN